MPKTQPELAEARGSAVELGPRLPNFGAAASVGPPSRAYRTHISWSATVSAVAPSNWDDESDSDSEAEDASNDGDDDDASGGEDADGADDTDTDESPSVS